MRSWLVGVLILACAWGAHAQSGGDSLLDRGVELYNKAKFRASIRMLERARSTTKDPKLLGRIELYLGLDHAVLGEKDAAEQNFEAALMHDSTIRLEAGAFKKDLVDLLESVRARMSGRLEVSADREGATVAIDGEAPVQLPHSADLASGRHTVEVYREGELVFTRKVNIEAGKTSRLRVSIQGRTEVTAGGQGTPGAGGAPAVPPSRRKTRGGRLWTWITGGAGVAVLAAGLGVYLSAGPMADANAEDGKPCLQGDNRPACQGLLDSIRTRENAGYALIGIGSALIVTSVVLFFVEGRSRSEAKQAALELTPLIGPTFAGAALRF